MKNIKYVRINLTKDAQDMYNENRETLLRKIKIQIND